VFEQHCLGMLGVMLANIFSSKVINYQAGLDRTPFVLPQTWCGYCLVISCLLEAFAVRGSSECC